MSQLVVGDIHGCFDELQDLLSVAGIGKEDQIVALGDIVDRGPQSPAVLAFFQTTPNAISIMGNHERKHIRSFRGEIRPALSQQICRRQIGEDSYEDACRVMEGFPRFVEFDEATLVHGFWEPGRTLNEQRETVIVGTLSGERYLRKQRDRPWYELYDGDKPLIVGHHDYLRNGQPLIVDNRVYAIDTGCCHGGRLTGLLLPEFRMVSVRSRRDYWTQLREEHADLGYTSAFIEQLTWQAAEQIVSRAEMSGVVSASRQERARKVRDFLQEGELAVERLYHVILARHEEIMCQIGEKHDLTLLTPRQLGSCYAAEIGKSPLTGYLHQMRRGRLTPGEVKSRFNGPAQVIGFVERHMPAATNINTLGGNDED